MVGHLERGECVSKLKRENIERLIRFDDRRNLLVLLNLLPTDPVEHRAVARIGSLAGLLWYIHGKLSDSGVAQRKRAERVVDGLLDKLKSPQVGLDGD
jgi:hypothetical protein